ncbi:hypothetical protein SAMN04487881_0345 [Marinobacter sp. es.048]|uniref:hypothetical protein n=1 Tax=Marinobacter sp. es.048 TaxID=1761795 RepID=UPI000B763257|nr:hypothetical protein [Marinobacter sp. es.048]SNC60880.1 hypothetical protein SAMN04487881_0345 [Marinobacter sp. es.048]
MTVFTRITTVGAIALFLTGCFDGSSRRSEAPAPTVDFTAYVKAQFARTSDTAEPANVNGVDLSFNDQNNPQAYDDLLQ